MKRFILGVIVAISIPVMAAVLWPSGSYLETFQNGFIFGTGKVLSVLNDVITFDGNRLDDRNKDIFYQEDFEGASVSFTCGTDLTAADETAAPIKGTSKSFTQGSTPPVVGVKCESAAITLSPKEQDKNIIEVCFNSEWNGNNNEMALNVYGNTSAANLVQVPITASSTPKKHCGYFTTGGEASIDYHIEALTQNANKKLLIDSIQFKVDPLAATDLYASSEPQSYTPSFGAGLGTVTGINAYWYREGNFMVIYGKATSGTVAADVASITLPSGYTIDSNYVDSVAVGNGTTTLGVWHGSTISTSGAILAALSTAADRVYISKNNSVAPTQPSGNVLTEVMGSSSVFSWNAKVPIAGWSDTAQGVVVKNRTDSASVENVFSAKGSSTGVISDENLDWINGNCSASGSTYTCTFNSGLFSLAPNCKAQIVGSDQRACIDVESVSASQIVVRSFLCSDNLDDVSDFTLSCQRQGTDYIKETDKVYTVPVTNLVENVFSARIANNGTASITSHSADFIESVTRTATTGEVEVVFRSGAFTVTPSINVTIQNTSAASGYVVNTYSESSSGFTYRTVNPGVGTLDLDVDIIVQRQGSDYIEPKGVYLGTFGQPTCYVKDVKSSGTAGGSSTATTTFTRDLNTTEGDCSFLSLASNQITLEAGAYNLSCAAPAYGPDGTKARIYNVDTSTYVIEGQSLAALDETADNYIEATVQGRLVISSTANDTIELRHYIQTARATDGLGRAVSQGDEIYSHCEITKVR